MIRATMNAPPTVFASRLAALIAIAFLPLGLVLAFGSHFALNWTDSMPRGFYWRSAATGAIPRGATVIACVPQPYAGLAHRAGYLDIGVCDGVSAVVKVVAATGGDRVSLTADGVRVNGNLLDGSKPLLVYEDGRSVPHVHFGTYVLRADQMWLASPKPRSFDSRYFGPVPFSNVQAVARPLLVFN